MTVTGNNDQTVVNTNSSPNVIVINGNGDTTTVNSGNGSQLLQM